MLPDTIHKLSREERFSYARLLAFMTRVDNELTVDEMAMFEQRLGTALLSPNQRAMIREALKSPPPLDECLAGLSEEAGRLALRDAVLMAAADGEVDDDEREVLKNSKNFKIGEWNIGMQKQLTVYDQKHYDSFCNKFFGQDVTNSNYRVDSDL